MRRHIHTVSSFRRSDASKESQARSSHSSLFLCSSSLFSHYFILSAATTAAPAHVFVFLMSVFPLPAIICCYYYCLVLAAPAHHSTTLLLLFCYWRSSSSVVFFCVAMLTAHAERLRDRRRELPSADPRAHGHRAGVRHLQVRQGRVPREGAYMQAFFVL